MYGKVKDIRQRLINMRKITLYLYKLNEGNNKTELFKWQGGKKLEFQTEEAL